MLVVSLSANKGYNESVAEHKHRNLRSDAALRVHQYNTLFQYYFSNSLMAFYMQTLSSVFYQTEAKIKKSLNLDSLNFMKI